MTTISERMKMKRRTMNHITSGILLISAFLCIITGFIKWPGLIQAVGLSFRDVPMDLLTGIHDWSGLVMAICTLVHVILHKQWFKLMWKKFHAL